MIKLTINGKEYSEENIDILINYDYIRDKTDVKLFNGSEELSFDSKSADFNISIDINSGDTDLTAIVDGNKRIEDSISIIQRANRTINSELDNISKNRSAALEIFQSLCKSIMNGSEEK